MVRVICLCVFFLQYVQYTTPFGVLLQTLMIVSQQTNGNECSNLGFYKIGHSCYWLTDNMNNATLGMEECALFGGIPMEVINRTHLDYIEEIFTNHYSNISSDEIYIGLKGAKGYFVSYNYNIPEADNWDGQYEYRLSYDGYCVVIKISRNYKWFVVPCTTERRMVCSCDLNQNSMQACDFLYDPDLASMVLDQPSGTSMFDHDYISSYMATSLTGIDMGFSYNQFLISQISVPSFINPMPIERTITVTTTEYSTFTHTKLHDVIITKTDCNLDISSSVLGASQVQSVNNPSVTITQPLDVIIDKLTKSIQIDKRQTGQFRRKYYCASDPRTSSAVIGVAAASAVTVCGVMVMTIDFYSTFKSLKLFFDLLRNGAQA